MADTAYIYKPSTDTNGRKMMMARQVVVKAWISYGSDTMLKSELVHVYW